MPRVGGAGQGQGRAQARPSQGQARGRGQSRAQALAQALAPEERVLARMESVQEALEVKDSLLAELYVSHIAQRQTVKTELVGRRAVLAARHEEETLRMEADILKIRAEMDLLAGELQELVEQGEGQVVAGADTASTSTTTSPTSSSSKSESVSLPCPSCPVTWARCASCRWRRPPPSTSAPAAIWCAGPAETSCMSPLADKGGMRWD